MGYSVSNRKLGFECDVCGVFIGNLKLCRSCHRCSRQICPLCARLSLIHSDLPPQFRRYRRDEKFSYICPDCAEELESERLEGEVKEEQEPPRQITTCQICRANDEPPESKIFGYRPPCFLNCDRCGRLVCDQCAAAPPDSCYDYDIVCRECYAAMEQKETREREEYWREIEEEKE